MQDKPEKCIVDSQGNAIKKDKNIKQFLTDSTKKILTVLLTSGIAGVVMEIFKEEVIYDYANSCASFYGVDKRYFSGIEMVEDKLVYIIALLVVVVGLAVWFLLPCEKKKTNGKAEAIIMFITIVRVLSSVNMLCILCIVSFAHWDWMRHWADQYAWGLMLLISSVILAYFLSLRSVICKWKEYKWPEKILLAVASMIVIINIAVGITSVLTIDISNKKNYEVIEGNRAIVSCYEGKFVVMDCKIQGETLILNKGTYRLEEMTGKSISYHQYEKVVCE